MIKSVENGWMLEDEDSDGIRASASSSQGTTDNRGVTSRRGRVGIDADYRVCARDEGAKKRLFWILEDGEERPMRGLSWGS